MDPVILRRPEHTLSRKKIDSDALKVLRRLNRFGHKGFLVGGGVRDILLGLRPKDFDVATDARPGELRKLFRNSRLIGKRFKLVHIFFRGGKIIEVSTFRRNPGPPPEHLDEKQKVNWINNTFGTPEEDAVRRDFTINALYYDIADFSIIDYTGGLQDLENGVIRTIGDPYERFVEDPVRIIRALDYTARLSFRMDSQTEEALVQLTHEVLNGAPSRLTEEILEIFRYGSGSATARLFYHYGIFKHLLPSLHGVLKGEDDPWFKALAILDRQVKKHREKPDDIFIFALLFLPSILFRAPHLTPSTAMAVSTELLERREILIFPKRFHHPLQQTLVALARMQQAPRNQRQRRIVTRQYFPLAIEVLACIHEVYPDLGRHFSQWRGLYQRYLSSGKLSSHPRRKRRVRRST